MCRHPSLIDAADLVRTDIGDDVDELLTEFLASDTVMIILIFEKVRQTLLHERKAVILCHRRYAHILKHFQKQTGLLGLVLVPRSPREQQIPRGAKICCEIAVIRCAPDPPARRSCVGDRDRDVTPLRCCSSASRSGRAAHGRARELAPKAPHLISLVVRYPFTAGAGLRPMYAAKKRAPQ